MKPNLDEWNGILKEYQNRRYTDIVVIGTKDSIIPEYFRPMFNKQLVCEPDPQYGKTLADYCGTTEYVKFSNNAVSDQESSMLYVIKNETTDTQKMYYVNSTTLDQIAIDYKMQCVVINCKYFQKKILLGGVDVVRNLVPTLIIKKNNEEDINSEYYELLEEIFHYRKVFDKDGYVIYVHHSFL